MTADFFLPWRTWLQSRREFSDWKGGCRATAIQVRRLAGEYLQQFGQQVLSAKSALSLAAQVRLWSTLAHHWEQQNCSMSEQIERLSNKQGWSGSLGSNPLFDAVLCDAVLHRVPDAITYFANTHKATILKQARILRDNRQSFRGEFQSPDDYVLNCITFMGGYARNVDPDLPRDERESGPAPRLLNHAGALVPSFSNWAAFVVESILELPVYERRTTAEALRAWAISELELGSAADLDAWWKVRGVPANAQQAIGVPLAKYRGDAGLAGSFVTNTARNFALDQVKKLPASTGEFAVEPADESAAAVVFPADLDISPPCREQVRRWLAAAIAAWTAFTTREKDKAFEFIASHFDELPVRAFGLSEQTKEQVGKRRWEKMQQTCGRMQLAFFFHAEQGLSNLEVAQLLRLQGSSPGYDAGQASRDLNAARDILRQLLQGLASTRRYELVHCVEASGIEAFRGALLNEWKLLYTERMPT